MKGVDKGWMKRGAEHFARFTEQLMTAESLLRFTEILYTNTPRAYAHSLSKLHNAPHVRNRYRHGDFALRRVTALIYDMGVDSAQGMYVSLALDFRMPISGIGRDAKCSMLRDLNLEVDPCPPWNVGTYSTHVKLFHGCYTNLVEHVHRSIMMTLLSGTNDGFRDPWRNVPEFDGPVSYPCPLAIV